MCVFFLVRPQFALGYLFIQPKYCTLSGGIKMEIHNIGIARKLRATK